LLCRVFKLEPEEVPLVLLSWGYFFCLLASYFILRPLREQMGIAGGVRNLPNLYLGSLAGMLLVTPIFSKLVARFHRAVFIRFAYRFALANLLVFFLLIRFAPEEQLVWVGRAFYIWLSVYNMFAVSVFWSFMVDTWRSGQAKRLFGLIGVCGTLGAITGSALTGALVGALGQANMLLISMVLLELAVRFMTGIAKRRGLPVSGLDQPEGDEHDDAPLCGPSAYLRGMALTLRSPYLLGISLYLFFYTITSTFLYFEQASIVDANLDGRAAQTSYFANVNLLVQSATLVTQLFFTGRIIAWIGLGPTLTLLPLASAACLASLAAAPTLVVNAAVQVATKGLNYSLARPAREALFTVLGREEKYKAKNFIDTFVYRGGDAIAAKGFDVLTRFVSGSTALAAMAVPIALLWATTGVILGRAHGRREEPGSAGAPG
jgi:AAA family ATP:ADP antiporter